MYARILIAVALLVQSWIFIQGVAIGELELDPQIEPNIERKAKEIRQLVHNAVIYFSKNSVESACKDFINKPIWRKGELFVFVLDADGTALALGDDTRLIWKKIGRIKSTTGIPLIKEMLALKKNGTINFIWNNAHQTAFVEKVVKNGETYVLGSGFFPESDEFITKQIVKAAVASFAHKGPTATFALISNPKGPFVKGDIYTFAYDFNGIVVAHGQTPALVGQNLIDQVDSRGKPIIRELIKVARNKGSGWVDYYWRNEAKRSYVERVRDPKTKKPYLIAAGYYPNLTLRDVESYVKRAVTYLKTNGKAVAFPEFSNQVGTFTRAGLGINVFDLTGKCLASGENPGFVGQNLIKVTDQEGNYYIRNIIETAKRFGRGFIAYRDYNAQAIAYAELVKVADGTFVIYATYFPDSKIQSTQTLVNRALELLREKKATEAFSKFTSYRGGFIQGDLDIFVYDTKGTRLVNGPHTSKIWHNFMKSTDQLGKPAIGNIIATAVSGGGWVTYQTRNATRRVYVKSFEKPLEGGDVRTFIVGSGYFM